LFCGDARNKIAAATSSTFGHASKSAFGIDITVGPCIHDRGRDCVYQISSFAISSPSAIESAATPAFGDRIGREVCAEAWLQRMPCRDIDNATAGASAFRMRRPLHGDR